MADQQKPSRLAKALLETAEGLHRSGLLEDAAYDKITMRHLAERPVPAPAPVSGNDVKQMREKAHLSQAVFAHHLKLTVGYVSQLERGIRKPTGPALVLLDLIRRKGIEAIL